MYPSPFPEPDTYSGIEDIRNLVQGYLSAAFQIDSHDYETSTDMVSWRYHLVADRFKALGVDEVDGSAGATFRGGKIQHLTMSFSPDATAAIVNGLDKAGIGGPISEALERDANGEQPGGACPFDQ